MKFKLLIGFVFLILLVSAVNADTTQNLYPLADTYVAWGSGYDNSVVHGSETGLIADDHYYEDGLSNVVLLFDFSQQYLNHNLDDIVIYKYEFSADIYQEDCSSSEYAYWSIRYCTSSTQCEDNWENWLNANNYFNDNVCGNDYCNRAQFLKWSPTTGRKTVDFTNYINSYRNYLDPNKITITMSVSGSAGYKVTSKEVGIAPPINHRPYMIITYDRKPTISNIPDKTINEDTAGAQINIDLYNYVYDPDDADNTLTYSYYSSGGSGAISCYVNANRYFTCSDPSEDAYGYQDFVITANDGHTLIEEQVRITVNPVNDAPTITGLPDKTINEDTSGSQINIDLYPYTYDVDNSDSELTFSVTETNSGLIDCYIDSNRYLKCHDPSPNEYGTSDLTVRARDPRGVSNTDALKITVNPINDKPFFAQIPEQRVNVNGDASSINIDLWVYHEDVDNQDLENTFTIPTQSNSDLIFCAINENRYLFCYDPAQDTDGTSQITVRSRDPAGLYEDTVFDVVVYPVVLDLKADTLNDTIIDWEMTGQLTDLREVDLDITAINNFLTECISDPDGYCTFPVRLQSEAKGSLTLSNINVVYSTRYEPVLTLLEYPADGGWDINGLIKVLYLPEDTDSEISNCNIFVDDELISTADIVTKDIENEISADFPAGYHDWYIECTDADNNLAQTLERSIKVMKIGTFDGNTTNMTEQIFSVSNIQEFTLEKTTLGKIEFSEELDLSVGYDFDTDAPISANTIGINTENIPVLNKPARISFYSIAFTEPKIKKDGADCPTEVCTFVSYENNILVYDVTGFSTYEVYDGYTPPSPPSGGGGGSGGGGRRIEEVEEPEPTAPVLAPDADGDLIPDSIDQYPYDYDNDGLPDEWELKYFENKQSAYSDSDDDKDKLTNLQEYSMQTNPVKDDTDGDGIIDGEDEDPLVKRPTPTYLKIFYNYFVYGLIAIIVFLLIYYFMLKKKMPKIIKKEQKKIMQEPITLKKVKALKTTLKKYKTWPKVYQKRVEIERSVAKELCKRYKKFSISHLIQALENIYKNQIKPTEKVEIYNQIVRWIDDDDTCVEDVKVKNIQYYKFI